VDPGRFELVCGKLWHQIISSSVRKLVISRLTKQGRPAIQPLVMDDRKATVSSEDLSNDEQLVSLTHFGASGLVEGQRRKKTTKVGVEVVVPRGNTTRCHVNVTQYPTWVSRQQPRGRDARARHDLGIAYQTEGVVLYSISVERLSFTITYFGLSLVSNRWNS
jgi:hypothetical protein